MNLINCNYAEFIRRTLDKKIICYGAGKMLREAEEELKKTVFSDRVRFICDKNNDLIDTVTRFGDKDIRIVSPSEMMPLIDKDSLIVITSGAFMEIIEELEMAIPENIEVYIFHFIRSYQQDLDLLKASSESIMIKQKGALIPKKIHYSWFSEQPLPDSMKRCKESWEKYCPDYEIIEWNERNCNIEENLYSKQAYEAGRFGFVPDYFRLKVIYEHGGIYLDTDVEVIKNLDDLLSNQAYASFETAENVNFGSGFGAVAGFPILKEMMEDYEKTEFINKDGSLNLVASPIYQTKVLARHGLKPNGRMQNIDGMMIYPFDYLCSQSIRTGTIHQTKNTYSIHRFAGSWVDDDTKQERAKKLDLYKKITF